MLTPRRSLVLHAESGKPLPTVREFGPLYAHGARPRHGEVVMVAGRSGTQKSGFALFWVAQMNLPTLYFSADMSPFTASTRLAGMQTGDTTDEVEEGMAAGGERRQRYLDALADLNLTFAFTSPITWGGIDEEIQAYVELWDAYPAVMVFDNLMDFESAQTDYTSQMDVMQGITELSRNTGATSIVLHHATDKGRAAVEDPTMPPPRSEIKGGLAEKPELCLGVALDPQTREYRIAILKQRMGPSDQSGRSYVVLGCQPELTRFHASPRYW